MMKIKVISVLLVASLLFIAAVTFAVAQSPSPTPKPTSSPRTTDTKMRACESREAAIKNRMQSLVRLAENMFEKFTSIFERVQEFYNTSGKSVDNYGSLVSEVNNKKGAVQSVLAKAEADANAFNCQADSPKDLYTKFRTDMQAVKSALKEYRTAIKNFIVAVRGANKSARPTASATPEATP